MLKKNDFQPGILPTQIINQARGRIKTILDRLKTNVLSYSVGGQRSEGQKGWGDKELNSHFPNMESIHNI